MGTAVDFLTDLPRGVADGLHGCGHRGVLGETGGADTAVGLHLHGERVDDDCTKVEATHYLHVALALEHAVEQGTIVTEGLQLLLLGCAAQEEIFF